MGDVAGPENSFKVMVYSVNYFIGVLLFISFKSSLFVFCFTYLLKASALKLSLPWPLLQEMMASSKAISVTFLCRRLS